MAILRRCGVPEGGTEGALAGLMSYAIRVGGGGPNVCDDSHSPRSRSYSLMWYWGRMQGKMLSCCVVVSSPWQ